MLPADSLEKIICKGCDNMSYYGFSDTGNVRVNNEDSFFVKDISDSILASVVADGMGGHLGGKEASSYATGEFLKAIEKASSFFSSYSDKQIENFIKNTVIKINKAIYTKSKETSSLSGMGTTLVACIIYNDKYYIANVGDSRLYIKSNELSQITKDHSYVSELLEMGAITENEAKNHPNKNVITRAVGAEMNVQPDIYIGKLNDDDTIIICTDGLTNMVSDEMISNVIADEKEVTSITNKLIHLAKENGGTDNITVVAIKPYDGGESKL